jgi:hypothetical protein
MPVHQESESMELEMTSQVDRLPARELKRLLDQELESRGAKFPWPWWPRGCSSRESIRP